MKKSASKKFTINWYDGLKALLTAMITAVVATGGQMFEVWLTSPTMDFDKVSLILVVKAAIGAGIGYLIKNFLTGNQTLNEKATQ